MFVDLARHDEQNVVAAGQGEILAESLAALRARFAAGNTQFNQFALGEQGHLAGALEQFIPVEIPGAGIQYLPFVRPGFARAGAYLVAALLHQQGFFSADEIKRQNLLCEMRGEIFRA